MKNRKFRLFSILIAVVIVISAISFSSFSYAANDEEEFSEEEFGSLGGGIAYMITSFANFLNNMIQARY